MDEIIKKHLFDIKESVYSINEFIGENLDFNHYLGDKMLRRAIESEFEIIGEALNRINKIDPNFPISSKNKL